MAQSLRVIVRKDVGWGNFVTLHGTWEGGGNWYHKVDMANHGPDRWVGEIGCDRPVEFKVVLNDCCWEIGPNRQGRPGDTLEFTPNFPPLPIATHAKRAKRVDLNDTPMSNALDDLAVLTCTACLFTPH